MMSFAGKIKSTKRRRKSAKLGTRHGHGPYLDMPSLPALDELDEETFIQEVLRRGSIKGRRL